MSGRRLSERQLFTVLLLLVVAIGLGKVLWPDLVPVSALAIPVIVGGWRLSRSWLVALSVAVVVLLVVELVGSPFARSYLAAAVVGVVVVLALRYSSLREQWGLRPRAGMALLLSVRDQLRAQGEPPPLPRGWVMARALRSADDAAFRGDFTLAHREADLVQVVVVDVSGHGLGVASRAMQLAGAFGGLVGVVPAERTLQACNEYLVRQQWDHDYATAVHLAIDLQTGIGEVRAGGHPAPRLRRADGTWVEVSAAGPILGLSSAARFEPTRVHVGPGDVLVLVTDGLLDEASGGADDEWGPVVATVEQWLAEGAPPGTRVPPLQSGRPDDDGTLVLVGRPVARVA